MAFVALGSNLGDSKQIVLRAFDRLQSLSTQALLRSSLWRSAPIDCPPGSPMFVNAVAGFHPNSGETPQSLLRRLLEIEQEFGPRPRTVVNAPRALDLDLIAFGHRVVNLPALIVPHPRAVTRRFVLQPMSEIAPNYVFPGQTETVAELLASLSTAEQMTRLEQ